MQIFVSGYPNANSWFTLAMIVVFVYIVIRVARYKKI
jgi:hypothetical protein